jgi:hypothetical protein
MTTPTSKSHTPLATDNLNNRLLFLSQHSPFQSMSKRNTASASEGSKISKKSEVSDISTETDAFSSIEQSAVIDTTSIFKFGSTSTERVEVAAASSSSRSSAAAQGDDDDNDIAAILSGFSSAAPQNDDNMEEEGEDGPYADDDAPDSTLTSDGRGAPSEWLKAPSVTSRSSRIGDQYQVSSLPTPGGGRGGGGERMFAVASATGGNGGGTGGAVYASWLPPPSIGAQGRSSRVGADYQVAELPMPGQFNYAFEEQEANVIGK